MTRASIPPTDAVSSPAALHPGLEFLAHPLPGGMRDLLPAEAEVQGALLSRVLGSFGLYGYQRVSLPAFEYAAVLERGLGAIEPSSILRFVEPETGEVVALRPDVTPQVARLVATRLAELPAPARLCYRGSVLRRQHERARHDQQILQAGIEFVGAGGLVADLEILRVTVGALRSAGLRDFVVDLGHGAIAHSLLTGVADPGRAEILEALSQKDAFELRRRSASHGLPKETAQALEALGGLHGGLDIFDEADRAMAGTAAEPHVRQLGVLARAVVAAGLAPRLVVDLGETRIVPYYTGLMFQVLAEGPGQAVASGGRYDALLSEFGVDRPAAGAAINVDHLRWALAGEAAIAAPTRVLVTASDPVADDSALEHAPAGELLATLRDRGVSAAWYGGERPVDYARAWRYSHVVRVASASSAGAPRVHIGIVGSDRLEQEEEVAADEVVRRLSA